LNKYQTRMLVDLSEKEKEIFNHLLEILERGVMETYKVDGLKGLEEETQRTLVWVAKIKGDYGYLSQCPIDLLRGLWLGVDARIPEDAEDGDPEWGPYLNVLNFLYQQMEIRKLAEEN
jgi:hypothetical protein